MPWYRTKSPCKWYFFFTSVACTFYPTLSVKVQILIFFYLLLLFVFYKTPTSKFNQLRVLEVGSTASFPGDGISVWEDVSRCSVASWISWMDQFLFASLAVNTGWKEEQQAPPLVLHLERHQPVSHVPGMRSFPPLSAPSFIHPAGRARRMFSPSILQAGMVAILTSWHQC